MEWFNHTRLSYQYTNDNRCLKFSVGRMNSRAQCPRILEQRNVLSFLELPGNIGCIARLDIATQVSAKQDSSNLLGQYHNYHVYQSHERLIQRIGLGSQTNTPTGDRHEYQDCSILVSGVRNWRADQLSRLESTYEWRFHPNIFHLIDRQWGPHQIDRFASMMTAQLETYNSLYWDLYTSGVNALAQKDWKSLNNFVNAPFNLLPQVMDIIEKQEATAMVIAPMWESQVWFQKLKTHLVDYPIPLPVSPRTLLRSGPRAEPLKNRGWRLFAWRLCGSRVSDV